MPIAPEDVQQICFRLHINDYRMLKKVLFDEHLSIQAFCAACVQAFLDGNPRFLEILENYRDVIEVPRELRTAKNLSHRERMALLEEIESARKEHPPAEKNHGKMAEPAPDTKGSNKDG